MRNNAIKGSFVQRCMRQNWYTDEIVCSQQGKRGGYVSDDEDCRENCDGG